MLRKTELSRGPVAATTMGGNHAFPDTEAVGFSTGNAVVHETGGTERPRRSRFDRAHRPERYDLTARDIEMILFIARIGCVTVDAVQDLLFGRWPSRVTARLRGAFEHRYLNKLRGRAVNEPDVYYLSPSAGRGWAIAESALSVEGRKPASLPHRQRLEETLMMARLFARLFRAARDNGLIVAEWRTERELRALPSLKRVVPDGYLRVARGAGRDARGASFLLELERSDKALAYWEEKLRHYVDLYESGRYQSEFGTQSLRILIVLDGRAAGKARLRGLADAALRQEATMVRLAPWSALSASTPKVVLAGPVWTRPGCQEPDALFKEEEC
jgi:hypothetical protein